MRDYGKVFTSIWSSETFRSMSEDGRALMLYLLTCPHNTIAGVFRLPDGYVCDDMQWSAERVSEAFKETVNKGFANRCETTKWVWINKHLEWNPPENPNQRTSAKKIAISIPASCTWKPLFMRVCGSIMGIDPEPLDNPCQTLTEPETGTGAGAEENSFVAGKPTTSVCPQQKILALYAELLPELPQPRIWEGARATNLGARWRWVLSDLKTKGKPHDQEAGLDFFRRLFEYVKKSDFLMGRAGTWSADLAWIVKAEPFAKIIQGNYENKEAA